jgi:GAF domain-containing protein
MEQPLAQGLSALSSFFVGDRTLRETLQRVSELVVETVPPVDFVGITMEIEGNRRTAVFTDPTAPEIDQAQYESGEGPCLTAFEKGIVTAIGDTREPGEWMEFRRAALDHGILSTLSLPLLAEGSSLGAMNLYSRQAEGFTEDHKHAASQLTGPAAVLLANSKAYWDARELSEGLAEAMKNRAVIEQAKGVLIAGSSCDEDEAFQMLVRASQRENVKLRGVARRIVEGAVQRGRQASGSSPRD